MHYPSLDTHLRFYCIVSSRNVFPWATSSPWPHFLSTWNHLLYKLTPKPHLSSTSFSPKGIVFSLNAPFPPILSIPKNAFVS
jgi:hypothetical protein